jgi:hypothetical protein
MNCPCRCALERCQLSSIAPHFRCDSCSSSRAERTFSLLSADRKSEGGVHQPHWFGDAIGTVSENSRAPGPGHGKPDDVTGPGEACAPATSGLGPARKPHVHLAGQPSVQLQGQSKGW